MPYWENLRGISALIYSLIKYRPKNVNLSLYSFNCNHLSSDQISKVRKELNVPVYNDEKAEDNKIVEESLFESLDSSNETYSTYSVCIINEQDSIDTIMEKYKVSRKDLEEYNNLNDLKIGTKLIIPSSNE